MRLNGFLDLIIEKLQAQPELSQVEFIKAYPNERRWGRLKRSTVAIGFAQVDGENISVDQEQCSGEIDVFFDIFVPLTMGSDQAINIFSYICEAIYSFGIVGISSEEITGNSPFSAYLLKTKITFDDRIIFGGENNE